MLVVLVTIWVCWHDVIVSVVDGEEHMYIPKQMSTQSNHRFSRLI